MSKNYRIERLGHLGDGIADGPVYAAGALPGELVTGNLDGDRLADVRIVEPSQNRIKPVCRHYRSCGGCSLQHASEGFVADWKVKVVQRALAAQGIEFDVERLETSPARSRRRAVLHGQRTKRGSNVGFFGKNTGVIANLEECHVLHPMIFSGLEFLHELTRAGGSRKGVLDFSVLVSESGLDVSVSGGKPLEGQLFQTLAQLAGKSGIARLSWDDETIVQANPPFQDFGGVKVVPPPGGFLQATKQGEAAMVAEVSDILSDAKRVVDLFAGCGTLSLPLAKRAQVHAVEGVEDLSQALLAGWKRAGGLHKVSVETRDLFARPVLADELAGFDGAIIDPPRAGAQVQFTELARSGIPRIAAVSCNPVTFAADAEILLNSGYELSRLLVVDQFRWSTHIEVVAGFSKS